MSREIHRIAEVVKKVSNSLDREHLEHPVSPAYPIPMIAMHSFLNRLMSLIPVDDRFEGESGQCTYDSCPIACQPVLVDWCDVQ